jgi:hypothetical protein
MALNIVCLEEVGEFSSRERSSACVDDWDYRGRGEIRSRDDVADAA